MGSPFILCVCVFLKGRGAEERERERNLKSIFEKRKIIKPDNPSRNGVGQEKKTTNCLGNSSKSGKESLRGLQ